MITVSYCNTAGCPHYADPPSIYCGACQITGTSCGARKVTQGSDSKASNIEATLAERGARYGAFRDHAVIAQNLQDSMRNTEGWNRLAPDQKQALSVIADKIARMLNGDPNYIDNWHDIIGYAKLVEDRLMEKTT